MAPEIDPTLPHAPYVTVTKGLRGFFAVLVRWNPEYGGFYEPWDSGLGSYATAEEAEPEARGWASDEGVEYRPRRPK